MTGGKKKVCAPVQDKLTGRERGRRDKQKERERGVMRNESKGQ